MQVSNIEGNYFVSPQIKKADLPLISEAGFKIVICNRPDEEVIKDLRSRIMESAVQKAGMDFYFLPFSFNSDNKWTSIRQSEIIASTASPVLAYCTTGTRCALLWALSKVDIMKTEDILSTTANAGYNLAGLSNMFFRE